MNIDRLIAISQDLGLLNEATQLQLIKERSSNSECELILPLVGEFSAGKTTLINALLESERKLETATEPTTATLFEIHFGAELGHAHGRLLQTFTCRVSHRVVVVVRTRCQAQQHRQGQHPESE